MAHATKYKPEKKSSEKAQAHLQKQKKSSNLSPIRVRSLHKATQLTKSSSNADLCFAFLKPFRQSLAKELGVINISGSPMFLDLPFSLVSYFLSVRIGQIH